MANPHPFTVITDHPLTGSGIKVFKWSGMVNGDVGIPVVAPDYPDKSVHAFGTVGASGHIKIQGSNEIPTPATGNYFDLMDPSSAALDFTTTPRGEQILENPYFIRPNVSAGDGTSLWDVYLVCATSKGR